VTPDRLPDATNMPRSGAEALGRLGSASAESPASASRLAPFFETWLDTFIFNGKIDPQLRELAILRLMWRCNQSFEWANHYRLARNAGLSRSEIVAIRTTDPARDLTGDVEIVIRAVDEIVDRGHIGSEAYAAVRDVFSDAGLLQEFAYLVAGYRMFASVSATMQVTAESSGVLVWPPDGVGPHDPTM
jgi:alkylhydroperoxidase family enzyme